MTTFSNGIGAHIQKLWSKFCSALSEIFLFLHYMRQWVWHLIGPMTMTSMHVFLSWFRLVVIKNKIAVRNVRTLIDLEVSPAILLQNFWKYLLNGKYERCRNLKIQYIVRCVNICLVIYSNSNLHPNQVDKGDFIQQLTDIFAAAGGAATAIGQIRGDPATIRNNCILCYSNYDTVGNNQKLFHCRCGHSTIAHVDNK